MTTGQVFAIVPAIRGLLDFSVAEGPTMRPTIVRSVEAVRDLEGLVDYFRTTSIDLARRFVDCSESTFRYLAENREVGHLCRFASPELVNVRVWPIERFKKHLVFFRPTEIGIEIVRVMHGARDYDSLFGRHKS